jgi:tripartite ATP-independent transporter DctM subunit
MLIPPSVLMIVYGVLTEQSIGKLFMAGIGPGLLVTATLSVGIWIMVLRSPQLGGQLERSPPLKMFKAAATILKPWGVYVLIALVLGGIYGGIFTPTEAGAIGAAGTFLLVVGRKKFTWRSFKDLLMESARTTASIFLLLMAAQMYSRMLALSGFASNFSEWAIALSIPPMALILMFVVVFVLLGTIIDSISILLLTLPIIFPVVMKLGYDPIWFGMVAVVAVEIGLLTPPFGMAVFSMKAALGAEASIEDIFLGSAPFLLMLFVALAIVIAVPSISTFLPSLL